MSKQIRPLLRSISSFYVRTQGIAFVDSIGVDPRLAEMMEEYKEKVIENAIIFAVIKRDEDRAIQWGLSKRSGLRHRLMLL